MRSGQLNGLLMLAGPSEALRLRLQKAAEEMGLELEQDTPSPGKNQSQEKRQCILGDVNSTHIRIPSPFVSSMRFTAEDGGIHHRTQQRKAGVGPSGFANRSTSGDLPRKLKLSM
jgi:hypothetical protein